MREIMIVSNRPEKAHFLMGLVRRLFPECKTTILVQEPAEMDVKKENEEPGYVKCSRKGKGFRKFTPSE